ncbi:RHS repeat-associated core domain-containing protein [Streptomyces sp. NPDC093097]|uniref:RHS repeat-associated core domain-containing protein n=1 Tax=Streptomyces sp. NPDC093097 TaxID=3366027 RepID=UPI003829F448
MPDGGQPGTQCFTYDALRRMTGAWTATDACAKAPSKENVGGPQPYWHSYGYDAVGNRTKLVEHDTEGNLAKITEGDQTTENLYDADGERLIHRAADGSTTLYLGDTELTEDKDGKLATNRYYEHPDGAVTVRTATEGDGTGGNGRLELQLTDHHGSGTTQIGLGQEGLPVERRLLTPFGTNRGAKPASWAGNRGFVAGREDEHTGLTQLGAREYDPTTGRFLSVDPLIDFGTPQAMNPYAYANNAPVTESDPDGLFWGLIGRIGSKVVSKLFKGDNKAARKGGKGKSAKPNKGPSAAQKARNRAIARQREAEKRMRQQLQRAQNRASREAAQRAKRAKANALRQRAKAKQRTANRAAPKRASKYRHVAKQRPKPRAKPTYRPRTKPAPKQARPQGSRQIKREIKSEVKEQAKEQVKEAVQPSNGGSRPQNETSSLSTACTRSSDCSIHTNQPDKITGYTTHGLHQAIGRNDGRGVNISKMVDAMRNPKLVTHEEDHRGVGWTFTGRGKKKEVVVLTQQGRVITTFGASRGTNPGKRSSRPRWMH